MNNMKKPKIRFKGFTDDWEQRKLGEVATIERGGSPRPIDAYITDASDGLNWVKIGDAPEQGRYINHTEEKIKPSGLSKTRQVFPGDLILSNSMSFGKPYIMGIPGCIHDGWLLIRNSQNVFDLKFLCHMLGTDQMLKQYQSLAAGSTVNNLNKELVSNAVVSVPNKPEQERIGAFLESIDDVITLHQRKYEKLQIIKKSMLENCFPKNGEKVPKIRFSGFTGDWEQRKVGEVIEDYVEKTTVQNQYPVLTSSQQQGIVLQEDYFADRQVTTNDNVGYYVLPRGYFTYRSRSDTDLFVFNRNNLIDKGIISYYYPVFRPKNVDSNFLLRRLNNGIRSQVSMAAEGTGQHVLAHSKLKNMEFLVPSVPEQKLIGAYFEILDHLITLHQSELEKLQKIKKSLLERMFV